MRAQKLEDELKRVIKILKMCIHHHIIRLYEVMETASDVYMFIEYIPGGELLDYIVDRNDAFILKQICCCLLAVAEGSNQQVWGGCRALRPRAQHQC